ncbi:uncharacterized protein [Parasteatoda tepidariorum]|uniref:uncharacterized protein n=1 Tax=Parasteatoda tepidariorum TaxID=114398 RepID=UPI001C7274A3|nr:uncharacterized protein LOC107452996 [Parasteatoda tepidariorum]
MLWTDSTIVLAWLQRSPDQLKTSISNRVKIIQELTKNCHWNHVASDKNPADVLSRGLNALEISSHELWKPPDFLKQELNIVPIDFEKLSSDSEFLQELKPLAKILITSYKLDLIDNILNRSNNYTKISNVLSYAFRFIFNCTNPGNKRFGKLSSNELNETESFLVGNVQASAFKEEIKAISKGRAFSGKSKLNSLNPFLGGHQIVRVGGRLHNAARDYSQRHPAILPANHPFTKLLMTHLHIKNLHLGPQALLYCTRERFWPLRSRSIARKIVHKCIVCFKHKPLVSNQLMGTLPRERVNPKYPFLHSGVDYCCSFQIKYKHHRKGNFQRIYVAIFVCLASKAIHLEVVSDLTTDAFLATLKRFAARRGKCATISSANAKSFVGASRELQRLQNLTRFPDDKLTSYLASEEIVWNFIPPGATNFGGLWEAGVKSF